MSVVDQLRRRVAGSSPEFECRLCAARYEQRRLNCPACGNTELEEA